MPYKDPENERVYQRAYKLTHRLQFSGYSKTYYSKNRQRIIKRTGERRKKRLLVDQDYRQQCAVIRANYNKRHPEVLQAGKQRRRARLRGVAINDFTRTQWREMKDAYGHRCVYCGRKMQRLTMDHLTPLSKGGNHTASNIVPACHSCNSRKNAGAVLCPVQPLLLTVA